MLEVAGVDVFRGESQVLWEVSLRVDAGERVAVLGSNGAGKSTLIAAILGAVRPSRGDIRFRGQSLVGKRPYQVARMGIAIVPEGRRVYRDMTVYENLEMGAYPPRARAALRQSLERVFSLFPVLAERRGQSAGSLSGGQQQMLAIGRALMSRPDFLIVDELSLGLAPLVTQEIFAALDSLGEGITVMLVEQNVEMALRHSQRAYVLESGRVAREGRSADLADDPEIRRAYLGL